MSDDFYTYGYRPDAEEIERNNRGYSPVGDGLVQDWETGEVYHDPRNKR